MQESTGGVPEKEKDQSRLDILGMAAATEGAANLLNIGKVLNEIDDSIIFVDKSFKNLVNTMGRGESYAEGFGKMLEATAKEIIRAGGTRDDASKIQIETLGIMGRASMLSQKQAVDLFNASKVTGVASKDLTEAFLDSGKNLSNISKEMLVVRETAQSLGVNAKQTSALVVSNLDKLNRFTFRGGVEGLAKMAANSQSMRIGMESTFELVDELMNPEKAIEMASEFQRMGIASADLTNPLKLMSMEAGELQEKLGEAMSNYVTIGEDGTKTISQMGRRVMKNLAAQGIMTRGELEKLAIGTREIQDKMSKINFSGFNLDEDTQKLIANVAQLGEGGVYEISTKDKDGNIVQKSIEDFVQDFGGDQEKLREALLSKEEKTGDASKDMSAIAQGQLDALTRITQQNEELKASIGFTVSASKLGPELLKASVELNKFINTPLLKNLTYSNDDGSVSDLGKGLDTSTKEIKTALEDFKSGNLTKEGLLKLLGDLGGTGKKLAGTFGEVGVNVVKDYAGQLGIGEETVTAFISGVKEKLPELKDGGAEVAYTILSGINEALEAAGIELPENLKEIYDVIEKETGTGRIETPKPPVLGSDKTTETPSPTPAETEKPKPPVLGSEITPGTGGDEGLLFLEDLQNLDLQQLTSQLIQPLEKLDVGTSEVGTLNVQNLNIGTALDGIVNTLGALPQNQTQLTTLEGLDLEAAVAKTTPTETASITGEGLPTIEEGLPEVDTTLKKTRGGFAKTEPSFSEMEYGSKAPSQYESFKKVLEQSYGGEIIGTGAEAFVLTPEMKSQAKKDSEFIGPEKPIDLSEELESKVEIPTKKIELGGPKKLMGLSEKFNPEIGSTKPTGLVEELKVKTPESPLEGETAIRSSLAFKSGNLKELEEKFPEASKKIRKEAAFSKAPGEKFELPELTKEEEEIMMEGNILTKPYDKLEEKYYDMKATQGRREAEKFEKEKLAGGGTLSKEDEKTLQSMRKRATEYANKSYEIEEGEVESFDTKIETKGLIEDKGLAPMKPTLASLPIPEKEEKQPLVKRIKEGIGGLKEKFKGKQEEETPIAAVPETQEEYVVKDKDGNIIGTSSTERTARLKGEKFAGGKTESMGGFTVEKQTATPKPPETPSVGVEKAAAEVKEPKTLRERIEQGADKLSGGIEKFAGKIGEKFEGSKIKSKIDEARSKIKPQEGTTKIEPIKEDMFPLSKGFDGPFYEMKDGKLQMRDPYEMLDEKEKKEKESSKIEPIKPETVPTLSEEDKKFQEERQRKMEEESKIISSVQTDAYGKPVTLGGEEKSGYLKMLEENDAEADKFLTSKSGRPVNLDNDKTEKIEPKLPTEETKPFSISDIKLSDFMTEDDGTIVEPAEVFPTEDEVRQTKEKEETKARSFAYLEELRLREQTPSVPETPAKGIEKLAQLGQKFEGKIGGLKGKLFGKKEEEESSLAYYEPGISTEEPYMSDSIEEAAAIEDYGTPAETPEAETETPVGKIEEVTPIVPEPATLPFFNWEDILGLSSEQGQPATQGESAQNINMKLTLEIVGNGEFAKLIDPRQFQSKIEMAMMQGIGKTQVAQRFNTASSFETASMGLTDSIKRY